MIGVGRTPPPLRFGDQDTADAYARSCQPLRAELQPGEYAVAPGTSVPLPSGEVRGSGERLTIEDLEGSRDEAGYELSAERVMVSLMRRWQVICHENDPLADAGGF